MRRFTDNSGQAWDIALTIGDVRRIQSATGINLLEPALGEDGKPAGNGTLPLALVLQNDLLRFYDILQALLERDADMKNIDAEQFGKRLAGSCLIDAHVAFFDEWHDFFLQIRRKAMADIVGKTGELTRAVYDLAEKRTSRLDVTQAIKEIETQIAAMDGVSSGISPDSSE